jgi:CrcB protein
MAIASVATFGLLGVFARYFSGLAANRYLPSPFPYGTFIVNLVGAALIGALYQVGVKHDWVSPELRVGLLVGFLGGFTTFSSYCLDAIRLLEEKNYRMAALYFIFSPILGLLGAVLGISATAWMFGGVA